MPKAKILLVEDSETQAKVAIESLQSSDYEVLWANSGVSALKAVVTSPPDLVLLDLMLPDMSGTEVCRWVKKSESTKGIPIIMLTVKGSLDDKVSGIESGADDYLPKPYSAVELTARIYAALRTKALQDELRQKNKQLSELLEKVELMAITDPLTGLHNRRHLETVFDAEWKKSQRYGFSIVCLLCDIDHFKSINDTCGHQGGDLVLVEIAKFFKETVRDVDTVARWGGEEFIAILPHTDKENGLTVARRVLERVSAHQFEQCPDKKITVSIGLSYSVQDMAVKEKLIEAADKALYAAKRNGRNRVEVYSWPQ